MFFKVPFALSGNQTVIPEPVQGGGEVSMTEGYGPDYELPLDTDPDAIAIERNKQNWLFYQVTLAIQQYQTHGFPEFITTADNGGSPYPYDKTATVRWNDGSGYAIYESLVDANTALPSDATKWQRKTQAVAQSIPTGVGNDYWGTDAPSGWVMSDGRTIGNGASGATNRANADTEALFTLLWNSTSNAVLGIQDSSGNPLAGRGASAAADFAANRRMPLPDKRGRVSAGKDDMGGAAANRLTNTPTGGVVGNILAASGGDQGHQLTVQQMPSHKHSLRGSGGSSGPQSALSRDSNNNNLGDSLMDAAGGDQSHNNVQPTIITNYIIKL